MTGRQIIESTKVGEKNVENFKESQREAIRGKKPADGTPSKHVIFLGAGASNKSGYPLANDLRVRMASRKDWEGFLKEREFTDTQIVSKGVDFWNEHEASLTLFRNGGFATLDEFIKLAQTAVDGAGITHGLRSFVRAALGIANPESHFETSEYYRFIQSLFLDDLVSLRDDVAILTYNYDPYLEYLLLRALEQRWRLKDAGGLSLTPERQQQDVRRNEVASGFYNPRNPSWCDEEKGGSGFCVLQLHGSIAWPIGQEEMVSYHTLFELDPSARAEKLFKNAFEPPIIFPWEIMNKDGFAKIDIFPFPGDRVLFQLFQGIWKRARREVLAAKRISFVGLSMHSFLKDGIKYLFAGKEGQTEVIVANTDNPSSPIKSVNVWANLPHTSAYTIFNVLKEFAPGIKHAGIHPGGMTLADDFDEFITKYMKPV
jgi:hypothetical protein